MSNNYTLEKHITLFKISGQDAATFLKNQTINIFDKQKPQPHYSAICNPKGRILYSLLLWQEAEDFYLAVDQSLAQQFKQYMAMRIFRMNVQISQSEQFIPVISDKNNSRVEDIILTASNPPKSADIELFWSLFFRSKLPWITRETCEQFIPQHLSLDQHQLIEYQKGCYHGQEIIARLHFIGRNKKHMTITRLDKDNNLKNGQKVTINDNTAQLCSPVITFNGQLCAQIVKNNTTD